MAAESYGTKGNPQFAAGGAPAIDVDPQQAGEYAALVGNHIIGTGAQRTAGVVPNGSGKPVWDGLLWSDTTDGQVYRRESGTWRLTGVAKSTFFRYHKGANFTWQSVVQPMIWDTLIDGALAGWTYANGVFTCVVPGLWEFDGRIGITTGSATANVRWYRNGTADVGYGGGQHANAFTSHGCAYKRVFAAGDTVEMRFVSTSTQTGVLTDGGSQLTWITCRYLGYY